MSLWSRFPFVRITLALVGGIFVAHRCGGMDRWMVLLLGVLLLAYGCSVLVKWRLWGPWRGLLGLSCVFLLGFVRYWLVQVCDVPGHLMCCAPVVEAYEAVALEDMHRKPARGCVVVVVRRARVRGAWQWVHGNVQLSFPKDVVLQVHYGDVLLVRGRPQRVPLPQNPDVFDYAGFLGLSQVYHQHWLLGEGVAILAHEPPSRIQAWSFRVLRYCQAWLSQCVRTPAARAVVLALVLGQKDALTPEVRSAYVGSGTMHVLAVSGLHVGILYWVVSLLLGFLKVSRRIQGFSSLVALLVLWFYAFVTGLSPSVLRATLMFTVVALAPLLRRQSNIYNTLAVSAFCLLYWNPNWLFAVGFQLSYLAVLGIVYLQPRIYGCWSFDYWVLDRLWLLSSVSLAAQLATAPVSLYYFQLFPTYFLFANWVVVPAVLIILCLGILVLATSFWPGLSGLLGWVLEQLVLGVNGFVAATQSLPYSLLGPIGLSLLAVVLLYSLLVLWLVVCRTRRFRDWMAMGLVVLLLSGYAVRCCIIHQTQCGVIFYSIDRRQAVAFVKGRRCTLWVDGGFDVAAQEYVYQIRPSQVALGITGLDCCVLEGGVRCSNFPLRTWRGLRVVVWRGKRFVFVDRGSLPLPVLASRLYADFLVVEDNAVSSLQFLLDRFEFETLVIGCSNTRSVARGLYEAAAQRGLGRHSLHQQGALFVSW